MEEHEQNLESWSTEGKLGPLHWNQLSFSLLKSQTSFHINESWNNIWLWAFIFGTKAGRNLNRTVGDDIQSTWRHHVRHDHWGIISWYSLKLKRAPCCRWYSREQRQNWVENELMPHINEQTWNKPKWEHYSALAFVQFNQLNGSISNRAYCNE